MKEPLPKQILNYFLKGLLYTLPITLVIYMLYQIFVFLDDLIPLGDKFPGAGVLLLLGIITLFGVLGSSLIAKPIKSWFNKILDRAPLLRTIYMAINDLLSAFVGQKKSFSKPVLVKMYKGTDIEKLGFVTDEDLTELGDKSGKVAVYFPHSFNFSGNLYIVPRQNVTPVPRNASDIMKYIVSGGVADIHEREEQ